MPTHQVTQIITQYETQRDALLAEEKAQDEEYEAAMAAVKNLENPTDEEEMAAKARAGEFGVCASERCAVCVRVIQRSMSASLRVAPGKPFVMKR